MTKKALIIEPRDTVIFRDGRPFESMITHAVSLDFPFPSTIAGGIRTRAGIDPDKGYFDANLDEIKKIRSHGTLLAELDGDGEINKLLLPAPADALLMRDADLSIKRYRLVPLDIGDALTDLPDGLKPVGHTRTDIAGKPFGDIRFWNTEQFVDWLSDPKNEDVIDPSGLGIGSLDKDARTHVAIDSDKMTSAEGMLFQTRGLDFRKQVNNELQPSQLALATFVDTEIAERMASKPALMPLGGERRFVRWRESSTQNVLADCPDEIKKRIMSDGHCRIVFLTPAYFNSGHKPDGERDFEVLAVACNRYQTVSGWDFEIGTSKPTARLMPAGSVLFVKITTDEIEGWIDRYWFNCVSDSRGGQDFAHDGFGLAVLGTWDGGFEKDWR
jgi:CRISPR/Cas system CMR-associated protein Cmr3 (group 5 of RAMP superfamily)